MEEESWTLEPKAQIPLLRKALTGRTPAKETGELDREGKRGAEFKDEESVKWELFNDRNDENIGSKT